ncbi:MAG: nitroreductase [Cyclobacteriaceae bacterium]|nr:nitroreductase [Cyclobacteriaceae bacterium]MDH4298529.1 nitroreductase [Cyclobacteriaceae bacterium]MDH5250389.1 nitroreductase [Cyclobacteriaceae bacterium]
MHEPLKTIYTRRAVRKYKNQAVDKKLIDEIIAAGRMAPSAMNRQPWKFYVLTDRKQIESLSAAIAKIAEKYFHLSHGMDSSRTTDMIFYHAPVVIFITAPKDNEWAAIDIGMCSQNMMLAAKSLGLDTCPVGFAKYLAQTDKISQLALPADEELKLAIIIGFGDEEPAVHERKKDNVRWL